MILVDALQNNVDNRFCLHVFKKLHAHYFFARCGLKMMKYFSQRHKLHQLED